MHTNRIFHNIIIITLHNYGRVDGPNYVEIVVVLAILAIVRAILNER